MLFRYIKKLINRINPLARDIRELYLSEQLLFITESDRDARIELFTNKIDHYNSMMYQTTENNRLVGWNEKLLKEIATCRLAKKIAEDRMHNLEDNMHDLEARLNYLTGIRDLLPEKHRSLIEKIQALEITNLEQTQVINNLNNNKLTVLEQQNEEMRNWIATLPEEIMLVLLKTKN